jgi:anti-sigma regulatory factor (Ser/Thr protein kinase)
MSGAVAAAGSASTTHEEWRLPSIETSVAVLRRGLRTFLLGSALSEGERYDLLLAACEAVSNAVEHARDPVEPYVEVTATIGGPVVTVVVCDHGQWRDATPEVHRGRGLAMMWLLADTEISSRNRGTTVTLRSSPRFPRSPVTDP